MFKKILVPLDGSELSQTIVKWAGELARALEGEIILLSVIDPDNIEMFEAINSSIAGQENLAAAGGSLGTIERTPADVITNLTSQLEIGLEAEARTLRKTGISASAEVKVGSPAEVIVAQAEALDVDLIAMSTRRESALARGVFGSVTDRVFHSTTRPLLALNPGELDGAFVSNGQIRNIVVPLDGSELSEAAVRPAMEIAQATRAEITFVRVVTIPAYGVDMGGFGYGGVRYAQEIGMVTQEEEAISYLGGFVDDAESSGIKAHAIVRRGRPSLNIVDEAATKQGSVVVMATHGASGLTRWVVGSVADKVVRSGHIPVLVMT